MVLQHVMPPGTPLQSLGRESGVKMTKLGSGKPPSPILRRRVFVTLPTRLPCGAL
jgi:hypothetical protein